MTISRRQIAIGFGGLAVAAGAGLTASRLLRKRHAPSPYDDLLALLDDRDGDAQIGEAVLAARPDFRVQAVADSLRAKLKTQKLADLAVNDAATGRLVEARGWVLPESIGLLCALAAKAAA